MGGVAHFANATLSRMRTMVPHQQTKSLSKSAGRGRNAQIVVGTTVQGTAGISCSMDPKITVQALDAASIARVIMEVALMVKAR